MGHHALGVDPRQALTGSRKSAGQSHLYVTRSKELLPTVLAGLFFCDLIVHEQLTFPIFHPLACSNNWEHLTWKRKDYQQFPI